MGRQTLKEVIVHRVDHLQKVYVGDPKLLNEEKELFRILASKNISVEVVSKETLKNFTGSDSHQSFVGKIKSRNYYSEKEFCQHHRDQEDLKILALDSIFDPQNMGALLRLAECFQYDGVIFSKNRGCDITPVVSKAASGATELISFIRVSNLAQSLSFFQKNENFEIVIADLSRDAQDIDQFVFPERMILVLGSEGEGVQPLIKKMADQTVKIPLHGKIKSLNVSQACAIFSYLLRTKGGPR